MRMHHGLFHQRNFENPEFQVSMPPREARPRFFTMKKTPALNNTVYVIAAGHRQIAERKTDSGWPFSSPGNNTYGTPLCAIPEELTLYSNKFQNETVLSNNICFTTYF
jgi:hypothetical protein